MTYYLIDIDSDEPTGFVVSADLSDGATRKQTVATDDCTKAMTDLASRLKALGFQNVSVQPGACKKRERDGAITAKQPQPKPMVVVQTDENTVTAGDRTYLLH